MPVKLYHRIVVYGLSLALLILVLQILEIQLIIYSNAIELYIIVIAIFFTILGIWVAKKLTRPKVKTLFVEKNILLSTDEESTHHKLANALSKRELEVLRLIAQGLSNQEIADQLFVSLNTVKTHISSLFLKLDVKRRTQAIEYAKRYLIIPNSY